MTREQEVFCNRLAEGAATLRVCCDGTSAGGGRAEILDERFRSVAVADLVGVAAAIGGVAMGTRIATARGEVRVEDLRPGDLVATREGGLRALEHVQLRDVGWRELGLMPILRPIRVRAGAFGSGMPLCDLVVSGAVELHLPGRQGLRARALLGQDGVAESGTMRLCYARLGLARAGEVLANGVWVGGICTDSGDAPVDTAVGTPVDTAAGWGAEVPPRAAAPVS